MKAQLNRSVVAEELRAKNKRRLKSAKDRTLQYSEQRQHSLKRVIEKHNEVDLRILQRSEEQQKRKLDLEYYAKIDKEFREENIERKKKKEEFFVTQTRKRLVSNTLRMNKLNSQKQKQKKTVTMQNQKSSLQHNKITEAFSCMAVWNVWDMDILKQVLENSSKGQTIEELVRKKAASQPSKSIAMATTSISSSRITGISPSLV